MDADLLDVGRQRPLVAPLGAVRILPDLVWQRLHGEHPPAAPERLTLRDTTQLPMSVGGWVLLGERPRGHGRPFGRGWPPTAAGQRASDAPL